MAQALVPVPMRMWLAWRIVCRMLVLMVLVVHMAVGVLHGLVLMLVLMSSVICRQTPKPITRWRIQSCKVTGSRNNKRAATAPMKGAVAK